MSSPSWNGSSPFRAPSNARGARRSTSRSCATRVALDSALERMQRAGRGAAGRRSAQQAPLHRPADLHGRRFADRRRPHQHGRVAGGPGPLPRSPVRRADGDVPGKLKIRGREKKYLLKRALAADLPPEILYRKKAGFSLPLARWLREDLRAHGRRAPRPRAVASAGVVRADGGGDAQGRAPRPPPQQQHRALGADDVSALGAKSGCGRSPPRQIVFWVSLAGVAWTYAGYPLLLLALARLHPRARPLAAPEPGPVLGADGDRHHLGLQRGESDPPEAGGTRWRSTTRLGSWR